MTPKRFRETVYAHYEREGRHHLPWRRTRDPYRILVSEIMLQQTQVDRVRPLYARFLERFPTVAALAEAPLREVLVLWQGLGYNRRARMLHDAAKAIVATHGGKVPKDIQALEALPGIGHYTARAVAAFAYNADVVFVETNLRTAVIHEFFKDREEVRDTEILAVLAKAHPAGESRRWYAALMDYGAHLKRSGVRVNAKSATYVKQAPFRGSEREARGALLRALAKGPKTRAYLAGILGPDRKEQVLRNLERLAAEGFVTRAKGGYRLSD
ncbi:MAG TPA: A/G-specific adenine glycosylase [Candidatus Paceibacterota bacterium]|nr:A/G-specific adenine glycosylase [Candidatus Paceibacterota bacterium]